LVGYPLPFIAIPIQVYYFAFALDAVGLPVAFVGAAVGEGLLSEALAVCSDPFSLIGAARFKSYRGKYLFVVFLDLVSDEVEKGVQRGCLLLVYELSW